MALERFAGDPPSEFEGRHGISRLVIAGDLVMVGATSSMDELGFVIGLTPYEQAVEVLTKVMAEFSRAGVAAADVVSLRAHVTDISRSDDVGRAIAEIFADVRPLVSLVAVAGLLDPRMLVEIEAAAYLPGGSRG